MAKKHKSLLKNPKLLLKTHWDFALLLLDSILTITIILLSDNTTFVPQEVYNWIGPFLVLFFPLILVCISIFRSFKNKELRHNVVRWIAIVLIIIAAIVIYLMNSNVNFLT